MIKIHRHFLIKTTAQQLDREAAVADAAAA